MTVKGLMEQLKKCPPDMDVLLATDEEGNGFKDVYEAEVSPGHGEDLEWAPVASEDIGEEYDEDDIVHKVVIWP